MIAALLGLLLTAAPSDTVLTAAAVEELVLPGAPGQVDIDVWRAELQVQAPATNAWRQALSKSRVCPGLERRPDTWVLRCDDGRLAARFITNGRARVLEVRRLRGLPWADGNVLRMRYPPERLGLGGPCPGTTDAGRAECALNEGATRMAEALLTEALTSPQGPYAHLRLGDLALALRGDVTRALSHYEAAGVHDTFGRLALLRRCELTDCPDEVLAYTSDALEEPVRTEVELRRLRRQVLTGDVGPAAASLKLRLEQPDRSSTCAVWSEACDGITVAALRDGAAETRVTGLALFLLQRTDEGERNLALIRQAADAAIELDAPRFAANLLASVTDLIPVIELRGHLDTVAALYLRAGDTVRAEVIRAYGISKFGRRWPSPVEERLKLQRRVAELVAQAAREVAVADALAVASRAAGR